MCVYMYIHTYNNTHNSSNDMYTYIYIYMHTLNMYRLRVPEVRNAGGHFFWEDVLKCRCGTPYV